ncbi:MAG: phosphoribosylamine--glycine ligase [Spirochaetota bacterium]
MKVLVLGSGGREHAIAYKLKQSPLLQELKVYPGNGGFPSEEVLAPQSMNLKDKQSVQKCVQQQGFDLVVVGPEDPLVDGVVDWMEEIGVLCFGSSAYCSQLEGSKNFAKQVMQEAGVPTAKYQHFSEYTAAEAYVKQEGPPIVIKADGLAAGKGVTVCFDLSTALKALQDIFLNGKFGKNSTVVIEEFMEGEEASIFALCDGKTFLTFPAAQDHKKAFEGDKGPNTGGMGAYAPTPLVTEEITGTVQKQIFQPVLEYMQAKGQPYRGLLYAGLMIDTAGKPKVVEFNCRFGDPETQALLLLLKSDLLSLLLAACKGELAGHKIEMHEGIASVVVLAAEGYPASYPKNIPLPLPKAEEVVVFHAGTKQEQGQLVSSGGRILGITSRGKNLAESLQKNYSYLQLLPKKNTFYRKDIGYRALK